MEESIRLDVPQPLAIMIDDLLSAQNDEVPVHPVILGLQSLVRVETGVLIGNLLAAAELGPTASRSSVLVALQHLAQDTARAASQLRTLLASVPHNPLTGKE